MKKQQRYQPASGHSGFKTSMLSTPTGGSFNITRRPNQTQKNFVGTIATARSKIKREFGVSSIVEYSGDVCTVTITSGLGKSPAAIAADQDKRGLRQVVRGMAPAPAQPLIVPVEEAPEVFATSEEARNLFKDVYLESIRSAPAAPPETHSRNATEAVKEYARRFPNA